MRLVNAYDYALCRTQPLNEEDMQEAYKIYAEEYFGDFLDFLVEKGSITEYIRSVFNTYCYDYDLDDENYYELNLDRVELLLNKVFDNNVSEDADKYAEKEV